MFQSKNPKEQVRIGLLPAIVLACLIVASPARAANVQILELGGKAFELRAKPASWAILDLNKFGLGALVQVRKGSPFLILSRHGNVAQHWEIPLNGSTRRYILDSDHVKSVGNAQIFKGFQKNEVWTFAIESTHVVHPKNSSLPSCQSGQAFVWHVTVNE